MPGVVEIFTHENHGETARLDHSWRDETAPPGHPFRPLHSERILFAGQPIALIVAQTFEAARDAASLVRVEYAVDPHCTDLERKRSQAYVPPEKRSGIDPPPEPRGNAEQAFAQAPIKISRDYHISAEHHNPMEMFATTCVFEGSGKLTIYDKTQGSQNSRGYVTSVFGLKPANVRLINHYVGGAFGSGLRPQHQLFLAAMASLALKTVGAGLVDPLADVPHRIPGRHLSDGVARFRSRWPIVVGDARHRCRDLAARRLSGSCRELVGPDVPLRQRQALLSTLRS